MDPYRVLGVSPSDDEETIKKAYRELAKKYHPDKYRNTDQYDWAMEKMKEINAAYDMLTGKNTNTGTAGQGYGGFGGFGNFNGFGGSREYQGNSTGGGYTGSQSGLFNTIRQLLSQRRTDEAETMLLNVEERPAEWYYLMGVVYNQKGWHTQARQFFQTASQMEPNNFEYAQAYSAYGRQQQQYTGRMFNGGNGNSDWCRICQCLLLAQCCGGGSVPFLCCC